MLNGEMVYLWRALDQEGEALERLISKSRDKQATLNFMKTAVKLHRKVEDITTDGLRAYEAGMD